MKRSSDVRTILHIHMPPLQAPALLPTNCCVTKLLVSHAANHMSCNVSIDGAWRGGCWHVYFILLCILNPQCVGLCPQTYLAERLKLGLAEHHLRGPLTVSKMQTKTNCENLPVVNWTSWFEQCSKPFWHSTIPDWFIGIIIIAYHNPCVYIYIYMGSFHSYTAINQEFGHCSFGSFMCASV